MAAKRARKERPVLSRQDIAHRKRAVSAKKLRTPGAARRALWSVFISAFSAMSLLSLATFNAHDRMGPGYRNAVGPVGHYLAEGLRGALGACAFILPFGLAYVAWLVLRDQKSLENRGRWMQFLSLALFVTCAAVFADLAWPYQRGMLHPAGGAIGQGMSHFLRGLFSTVGTVILVTSLGMAALILGTQFAFLRACNATWNLLQGGGNQAAKLAKVAWQAQRKVVERQREAIAQRKLEDAAFIAQLEADEDEIEQAEREAQEAEAASEAASQEDARRGAGQRTKLPGPIIAGPAQVSARGRRAIPLTETSDSQAPEAGKGGEPLLEGGAAVSSGEEGLAAGAVPGAPPVQTSFRMPVIVEPKAPPKPTVKKPAESFEFIGDRKSFTPPPLSVLECDKKERSALDKEAFLSTAERLRAKLNDFGIEGDVVEIRPGPVVTMYEFLPGPGVKVSRIASLADDLAMAMEAMRVRIVAPIPGKGVVGIEVPNRDRETVFLKEIAEQDLFLKSHSKLSMCVGKDIEGMPYVFDLAKAPHLLIAGTTGSGKSVAVNSMIMSILLKSTPEEVRFIMVDPKMLELSIYEGIPHLLLPVVTDPKKAALALRWTVEEMERRYQLLSEVGVRNIAGYNKLVETVEGEAKALVKAKEAEAQLAHVAQASDDARKLVVLDVQPNEPLEGAAGERARREAELGVAAPVEEAGELRESLSAGLEAQAQPQAPSLAAEAAEPEEKKKDLKKLPYIVLIIDELADLMMVASREVETYIARLAQMARAAGIHLMVATQRPSTDVVTGIIKANFPTRISFMLRSKPDSMTILGTVGAEALLGMGDMLIMPPTSAHLQRVHGAYVSEDEIKRAVNHLKAQGKPVFDDSILKPREEDLEEGGGAAEDELSDELYDQALAIVSEMRAVSISMLQRKMRIGYNRAARMIERMERDGVVGAADGAKPREVLLRPVGEMPGAGA